MNLFDSLADVELRQEPLGPGATVLRQFAVPEETALLSALVDVMARAPFRHMVTPGGFLMPVAMTNCGALGWATDRTGYRYRRHRSGEQPALAADAGCLFKA